MRASSKLLLLWGTRAGGGGEDGETPALALIDNDDHALLDDDGHNLLSES